MVDTKPDYNFVNKNFRKYIAVNMTIHGWLFNQKFIGKEKFQGQHLCQSVRKFSYT